MCFPQLHSSASAHMMQSSVVNSKPGWFWTVQMAKFLQIVDMIRLIAKNNAEVLIKKNAHRSLTTSNSGNQFNKDIAQNFALCERRYQQLI